MIKAFKIISLLEGLSYLGLLFIGVPLDRIWDNHSVVKALGMPHGMLFIAYVLCALYIKDKMEWDNKTTAIVLVASILPFGTFYINKKYMSNKS